MKIFPFLYKSLPRWLILSVILLGNMFTAQTALAVAGPCSMTPANSHFGLITADETWCAGGNNIHVLTDNVTVLAGVTLTIEPGVTLVSVQDSMWKYLIIQGHLDVLGTAAQPVIMKRYPIVADGPWGGIYFDGSAGDGSGDINYATIEESGAPLWPSGFSDGYTQTAVLVKNLPAGKQVNISHSTISNNVSRGLFVVNSTVNVTDTTFSQNIYPILIEGAASVVTYSGNTFSDNAYPYYDNSSYTIHEDSIFIGSGALMGQNFSLPAQSGLDAYVFLDGATIPVGKTMTVEPGVTVRMEGNKYLTVQGNLNAIGTQALPIRFSGIPSSDPTVMLNWGGLYFEGSAGGGGGNLIHTVMERGGSNFLPPSCTGACGTAQTAVFVKDLPADKQLNINHSIIEDSLSKGLYVVNSPTAQVNGNLIKGGRIGAYLLSNMTISNLALIDQALYGVVVESGYSVDARHLTIARAGQIGFYTGGTSQLKNSILSHNTLAVKAEGSGQATLDTNLADANTTFKSGAVTDLHTINGAAVFEADGYHIQTTSAAVGNGLAGLSSVDIDGNTRPSPAGSLPDLGADEILAGAGTVPTVLSSVLADTDPTNATSVHFAVTFSEPVVGVDVSDFALTTTGVTGATISNISGTGATRMVTVNTGTGNGTIRLNVPSTAIITDLSGNFLASLPFTSGEAYTIMKTHGADTVGVFRPSNGLLYLKNSNTTGYADVAINYGIGGDYPVVGDWDGDGDATIGIYRNGTFYLRNSNTVGYADFYFGFGSPGDQPIAGDWNNDGIDTIGVYRSSNFTFYLRNSNTAGAPDVSFSLGIGGDVGFAGDWDGDGLDTTGVFRPSSGVIFLKNMNSTGYADIALNYGIPGDKPLTGDWNNDGIDTIGVLRGNTFYLRNTNTVGYSDLSFALGIPGDMPIAGNWDGIP